MSKKQQRCNYNLIVVSVQPFQLTHTGVTYLLLVAFKSRVVCTLILIKNEIKQRALFYHKNQLKNDAKRKNKLSSIPFVIWFIKYL